MPGVTFNVCSCAITLVCYWAQVGEMCDCVKFEMPEVLTSVYKKSKKFGSKSKG